MKLNEVFDSSADWEHPETFSDSPSGSVRHADRESFGNSSRKHDKHNESNWSYDSYSFTVGGEKYSLSFYRVSSKNKAFQPTPKNLPVNVDYVGLTDSSGRDSVTGRGSAYKVFATALDIIKNHIKETKTPAIVGAETNIPSRVKLYSRLFDNIAVAKWKTDRQKYHPDYAHKNTQDEVLWLLST